MMMKPTRAIGIMSGTSGDGVDALLLELDGVHVPHRPRVIASAQLPFTPELTHELVHARDLSVSRLTELSFSLPRLYADAVRLLPDWHTADCVGMHGQTITHQVSLPPPAPRGTWQLGATAVLAQELALPVVGDLRSIDVALGGQGAPIVPMAHWFFLSGTGSSLVVNLGGICNASIVTPQLSGVIGFDVGPGMMVSDAFAKMCSQNKLAYDRDGEISRGGQRVQGLFDEMLAHPFVARPTPKSAGREEFGAAYYKPLLEKYAGKHESADIMITLLMATTEMLARAVAPHLRETGLQQLILTGGGARNPTLQKIMAEAFAPMPVKVETEGVMAPQNHEPAAMALFAARTMQRLPSGLPGVTGAAYGAVLGHITWPTPVAARVRPAHPVEASRARAAVVAAGEQMTAAILDSQAATAVSLHVMRGGETIAALARGHAQRYVLDAKNQSVSALAQPSPLSVDSLFDLASLTKVLAAQSAIMALVSDGRLALHARAALFVPALKGTDKRNITIDQLLRHRAGLAPWAPLYRYATDLAGSVTAIARLPLRAPPGSERIYSDLGYVLLSAVISQITGMGLDVYLRQRITGPLGLTSLDYIPSAEAQRRCVATAHDNGFERRMIDDTTFGYTVPDLGGWNSSQFSHWRERTLRGEVNDGNTHHALGGVSGHAGLFGTARDVAALAAAMTMSCPNTQAQADALPWRPEVVRDALMPLHGQDYLGWANPCSWPSLESVQSPLRELGGVVIEGFTGGLVACFPGQGVTAVLLTNRQHQPNLSDARPPSLDALRASWVASLTAYAAL